MRVYAIEVTLLGTKPSIWRRFLVERDITLPQLHSALQILMGWTNSHLHQFIFQKRKRADGAKLGDLIGSPGSKLLYEYDFGDGWQHELLLEENPQWRRIVPADVRGRSPSLSARGLWRSVWISRAS